MKNKISVYILSHNRPQYILETIDSVLKQTLTDFKLTISDNSTNDDVQDLIKNHHPGLNYIRQEPGLSALAHFKLLLESVDSEYFVLFHDDDIMHPDYLENMISIIENDPGLSAVACNAKIVAEGKNNGKTFFNSTSDIVILNTPEDLFSCYCGLTANIAPFPGYVYRKSKVGNIFLDPKDGGKYSDVSFLMKIMKNGAIAWAKKPLISYRIHSGNDSATISITQKLRLIRFVLKQTSLKKQSAEIKRYRLICWLAWLKKELRHFNYFKKRKTRKMTHSIISYGISVSLEQPGTALQIAKKIITSKLPNK